MKVIGVVGQPLSGKDTVANYISKKGFRIISSGDMIREDMAKENIPLDRENMSNYSTKMRQKFGMEYPMNKLSQNMSEDFVISGMRNTAEISFLRKTFESNFTLLAIETPIESRYQWAKKRGRIGDDFPFEKFKEIEDAERINTSGGHNVDEVLKMADYQISNSGTEEDLYKKVDEILEKINQAS